MLPSFQREEAGCPDAERPAPMASRLLPCSLPHAALQRWRHLPIPPLQLSPWDPGNCSTRSRGQALAGSCCLSPASRRRLRQGAGSPRLRGSASGRGRLKPRSLRIPSRALPSSSAGRDSAVETPPPPTPALQAAASPAECLHPPGCNLRTKTERKAKAIQGAGQRRVYTKGNLKSGPSISLGSPARILSATAEHRGRSEVLDPTCY